MGDRLKTGGGGRTGGGGQTKNRGPGVTEFKGGGG